MHRALLALVAVCVGAATLGLVPIAPADELAKVEPAQAAAPMLPPCGIPPTLPPPRGPTIDMLGYAEEHECVPQWTTDEYKRYDWVAAGESTSKKDPEYVVGAAATLSPSTLVIGDGSPQQATISFASLYDWQFWDLRSNVTQATAQRGLQANDQIPSPWQGGNNLYRYRLPGEGWDRWSKSTNAPPVVFKPLQACPTSDAMACPVEATFDPFFVGKDVQMLVPIHYNIRYPCATSCAIDPIGNTTYLQINIDGGGEVENEPPDADFSVTPVSGEPGTYDFTATTTDPEGDAVTHAWTFPGGESGQGDTARHTFTSPGSFEVTLEATDSEGNTDQATKTVEVAAPVLDVDVRLAGNPSSVLEDDEVEVVIDVTASADGVGNLTGLALDDPPLEVSDTDLFELTGDLTPEPATFSLAPGATKTFRAPARALAAGTVDLTASAAGKDGAGRAVSDRDVQRLRIRSQALALELSLDLPELTLDEDEEGPKPRTVALTVKGTNRSDDEITDITLGSIQPSWQLELPYTSTFPSSILEPLDGPGAEGEPIGDLAEGESFERTYQVKVHDDGHLRLGTDATFALPEGGTEVATGDVDILSKPKYVLAFEAEADASVDDNPADPWNGPDAVGAGRALQITGSLENRTTDQRVVATVPRTQQVQLSSVNLGDLVEEWEHPATPFRHQLDPGASVGVKARPVAIPVPGKEGATTFAKLSYGPQAKTKLREDDELTDAPAAAILAEPEQRSFTVPIAWPPPVPGPGVIEFYGLYSKAFIESSAAWWANAGTAVADAVTSLDDIAIAGWKSISDPVEQEKLRQQVMGAWASFVNTLDTLKATIDSLTPAQKLELIAAITNPMVTYLRIGGAIATSEEAEAARQAIGTAIGQVWTRVTTLADEDPRELARQLGDGSAVVFNEITVGMVTDAALAQILNKIRFGGNLALSQQFLDDAAAAAAAEGLRIEKGLKGIPAGAILTDEVLTIGLGITKAERAQIQAVAKRFNLRVMARSRGAGAADLIAAGRARLKPFGIDAKNVSDVDVLLGFPAKMKDTVAIRKPRAWADVAGSPQFRALDAEQQAQVAARWETRSKEWTGGGKLGRDGSGNWMQVEAPPDAIGAERQKFLDAAQRGTFDLQFPTKGNWEQVAVDGKALGTARADFALDRTVDDLGEILQPRMNDVAGGDLLPITGDVDLVALLNPDGTYPDPAKVIAAYLELAKPPLRMQHPATWSFEVEGKSVALLSDHLAGSATAEPLADFDPTGVISAVLFNPKTSLLPADRAATPATFIKVAGGVKLPSHAYGLGAALPAFIDGTRPTKPYYEPEDWEETLKRGPTRPDAARAAVGSIERAESTAGVRFTRGAPPTEELDDGSLTQWVDGAWRTWSPLPAGALPIAPQSCLADDLEAGDTSIPICSLASLFEQSGTGGQQWFAVGDQVAIDLRGDAPWTSTITAIDGDRLTFAAVAPADYLPGTTVHLLPAQAPPVTTTTTAAPSSTLPPPSTLPPGASSTASPTTPAATVSEGNLPRTGTNSRTPVTIALVLIALGALAIAMSRRRRSGA